MIKIEPFHNYDPETWDSNQGVYNRFWMLLNNLTCVTEFRIKKTYTKDFSTTKCAITWKCNCQQCQDTGMTDKINIVNFIFNTKPPKAPKNPNAPINLN